MAIRARVCGGRGCFAYAQASEQRCFWWHCGRGGLAVIHSYQPPHPLREVINSSQGYMTSTTSAWFKPHPGMVAGGTGVSVYKYTWQQLAVGSFAIWLCCVRGRVWLEHMHTCQPPRRRVSNSRHKCLALTTSALFWKHPRGRGRLTRVHIA